MNHRPVLLLLCGLVLGSVQVHAFNVYRLGGEQGNPWAAGISYEPGEFAIIGSDGAIIGRGRLAAPSTHPTWSDTLGAVVDSTGGQWLRPFFLPDTLNLARDGVRDRIKRGISHNLVTSGPCYNNVSQVERIRPIFDGDPNTAAFFTANASDDPEIQRGFYIQNSIADLGVDFPINRIRFFPRLGTSNPKIDDILAGMEPPMLDKGQLREEDFSANFLPWFEVAGANSRYNFAANCFWQSPTAPFFQGIQYTSNPRSDSRWTVLRTETENLDIVVDIRFPTQQFQWVTFRPVSPTNNWEIAEFQVFGLGYVERAVYTTAVLDFGQPMAWGKIRWSGTRDANGRVLIRTRTGRTPDPNRYWLPSNIPGELREISRKDFERADIVARTFTLDEENWSFWSSPYEWEEGLRREEVPAAAWEDGIPVLSPGPARYLQIQVVFLSTLDEAGKLRELELQFSAPAAQQVVGEVWPVEVPRTESTTFTYSVLPRFSAGDEGFDRLEIFTLTRADRVRSVKVDGSEMMDQFPPQILDDRLVVSFPRLQGEGDTFKLIEVAFDAHVVRYGTEFQGWVFDSQANNVKQLIEPGDANVDFPGNALGVRTTNLGAELIASLEVAPNPFTPNSDGINDEVRFHFQLHEVSTPRLLSLEIYDISGRRVRQVDRQQVIRGLFGARPGDPTWDGLDEAGRKVAPGLYLYRISLETDLGAEEKTGTIAVAY